MNNNDLRFFFERFIRLGFWERLFRWREIRALSYRAFEQLKSLEAGGDAAKAGLEQTTQELKRLTSEAEHAKKSHEMLERELRGAIGEKTREVERLTEKLGQADRERSAAVREIAEKQAREDRRQADVEKALLSLETHQKQIIEDRKAELSAREKAQVEGLRLMKEQWSRHQDEVRSIIRRICARHGVEYVTAVPFKGNPDNTIRIAGDFVVLDAKSPGSEDLRNFPLYIKAQAEAVRKYAKEEGVRKEIFLVIPSGTADVVEQTSFNMADYSVYVITPNALEPIILSLRRLEDYEFVDQLNPGERENICRLIGKFAHVAKRRIQVDHFFAWEFLEVLTRCEANLPKEMLKQVMEFERSEKMNPPQERRSKQILTRELEEESQRLQREAQAKAIEFPPSLEDKVRGLPLFREE